VKSPKDSESDRLSASTDNPIDYGIAAILTRTAQSFSTDETFRATEFCCVKIHVYAAIGFVKKLFAPLAQLAEQVTLNCGRSQVIKPPLPNTLRNFRARGIMLSMEPVDSRRSREPTPCKPTIM